MGTGLAVASSFVALNTFFDKKRGQAVGFSMAGTAFGMILLPLVKGIFQEKMKFPCIILIIFLFPFSVANTRIVGIVRISRYNTYNWRFGTAFGNRIVFIATTQGPFISTAHGGDHTNNL